jgi:nickel-dependent lactate racemase
LKHARVIYISDAPDEMVRNLHMIPAHSIDGAVKMAEDIVKNPNASITVIPDGVSVIVLNNSTETPTKDTHRLSSRTR